MIQRGINKLRLYIVFFRGERMESLFFCLSSRLWNNGRTLEDDWLKLLMVLISTFSEFFFFFKDNFKHYNPESLTWIFTFSDTQSLNMELLKGRTGEHLSS